MSLISVRTIRELFCVAYSFVEVRLVTFCGLDFWNSPPDIDI